MERMRKARRQRRRRKRQGRDELHVRELIGEPLANREFPHPFRRPGYRPGGRSPPGRWGTAFFLILAVFLFFPSGPSQAATFTVNSTTDGVDSNPGNGVCATAGGVCTLRAAIQEAVVSVLASARAGAETATKHEPETSPSDRATGERGDRFRRVGGAVLQRGGLCHPGDDGRIRQFLLPWSHREQLPFEKRRRQRGERIVET